MNRNTESYFSTVPTLDINRSSFDMSQDLLCSFDVGELIPFAVYECLPGDTFKVETSKVCRLQTLLTPIFSNLYLDTYWFFIPYRLVWTHWKNFMGENTQSAWLPEVTYTIPQCYTYHFPAGDGETESNPCYVHVGDFADYMGIPVNVPASPGIATTFDDARAAGEFLSFSALPIRAAQLVWNEWFRDENLQDPLNIATGDGNSRFYTDKERETYGVTRDNLRVNKFHDYFTSALPAPLKGEAVMAPVTTSSKVDNTSLNDGCMRISGKAFVGTEYNNYYFGGATFGSNDYATLRTSRNALDGSTIFNEWAPSNLGVNIMALRNAFQVQKLLERDARSGTRYTEIIKGHFSVTSPDSRLQRPEYLGGNRIPITIHQIINQAQGESQYLGDLGAMSLTTDKHSDFIQSFTEHGVVIGFMCARYDHSYPQGLQKFWSRKTRFDFYWPEFANLSETAILNKEIYAQGIESIDNQVFGYQEAWADYRYAPNRIAGELRPGIANSLASWHLGDNYDSLPYLSSSWIKEDKTNVDRTLAVTSSLANQLFCDVYVDCIATRPMPVRSIPGLADHF